MATSPTISWQLVYFKIREMKKLLTLLIIAIALQSCSDKLCPAYPKKIKSSKRIGGCYFGK